MTHQRTLGLAAVAVALAVSFAALVNSSAAGQQEKPRAGTQDQHFQAIESCAKACSDCQRICDMCATHCAQLVAQGKREHLRTLQTCQDCASFCATAAQIVSRRGPFSDLICRSCADACARCGKECEQLAGDSMMTRCAEECRRCQKECQAMLQHLGNLR